MPLHCLLTFLRHSLTISHHHFTHLHHHLTLSRRLLMPFNTPFNTPVAFQRLFVVFHSSTLPFSASSLHFSASPMPFNAYSTAFNAFSLPFSTPLRRHAFTSMSSASPSSFKTSSMPSHCHLTYLPFHL